MTLAISMRLAAGREGFMCLFKRSEACFGWTFLTYLLHLLPGDGPAAPGFPHSCPCGNESIKASLLTDVLVPKDVEEAYI